jgi:DNA-binding SARP family transcriptional activator
LLGGFRVSVGARTVEQNEWRLRKAAALIKLLALAPGHRLHREQAMDSLWPNLGRRAALNNLRQALYAARKVLDPVASPRYLSSEDEQLLLCPEGQLWVDAQAFEEAAETARRSQDPTDYRAAIVLYAGDLLPGDRYEEWAEIRRQGLRSMFLSLLVEMARLYQEREEFGPATEALKRALAEEPVSEEMHADLIRLYAHSGRPGEVLSQYERLRDALFGQLGREPGAAIRDLRDEIAAGRFESSHRRSSDLLEEAPVDVSKHNLPAQRTSFVGRERELAEVKRQLAITRLLTLTGAGGSGKTRLAVKVAKDLVGTYPDGVWLVELAPLLEEALLSQAVAEAMGVPEQPGRSPTDALVDALRGKRLLLVLDNCEHLIVAAAQLVDHLLACCPHLRVLATSREVLGVEGEAVRRVPPLSLPDVDGSPEAGELARYDAVRLFVDRAKLRLPDFEPTPRNAGAVAEICRRLEGIPLAIELAAARVGTLSVEQISERLKDSLRLLASGSKTAVPRQRTLRGTLDWSHNLLLEEERKLFARVSVFAGGWALDAAEAVSSERTSWISSVG